MGLSHQQKTRNKIMRNAHTIDCPTCGAPAKAYCVDQRKGDGCELQMERVHLKRALLVGISPRGGRTTAPATAR